MKKKTLTIHKLQYIITTITNRPQYCNVQKKKQLNQSIQVVVLTTQTILQTKNHPKIQKNFLIPKKMRKSLKTS